MKRTKITLILGAILAAITPFNASGEDIIFNTIVTDTCSINVTRAGTLDLRPNLRRLTSRSGPGIPGRAIVNASGPGFTLSVDAPTAFTTEPVLDVPSPENFRAWHRSNGATTYGNTRQPESINSGVSNIRIHMDARKPVGNLFEAGDYSAIVVLRCE